MPGRVEARSRNDLGEAAHVEAAVFSQAQAHAALAFKRRVSATASAPAILELSTLKERVIEVPISVDDQIEWLDDHTIVYEVVTTPLLDTPKFGLHTVDRSAAAPKQVPWMDDARSPTFVR